MRVGVECGGAREKEREVRNWSNNLNETTTLDRGRRVGLHSSTASNCLITFEQRNTHSNTIRHKPTDRRNRCLSPIYCNGGGAAATAWHAKSVPPACRQPASLKIKLWHAGGRHCMPAVVPHPNTANPPAPHPAIKPDQTNQDIEAGAQRVMLAVSA